MPHKPILLLVAVALIPVLAQPAAATGRDDLEALGWLAGCWEGQGGGGRNEECWTAPGGGMMLAVNRVITERGAQFEFLRIASHGDGLALLASPSGKPAVAFPLVESAERRAVFANPEHDFPQRITYRRDGDALTARVEALQDGEWRGFDIAWRRASEGGPKQSPPTSRVSLEEDRRALLAIHQADIRHHVEGDPAALMHSVPETFLAVSDGKIHRQPKSEVRAFFERYLRDAEYEEYRDLEPPVVRVSADGTMAWIVSRLRVKRRQPPRGGEGEAAVREFVYAGIMTYEKVDGRWIKVANVSTFER